MTFTSALTSVLSESFSTSVHVVPTSFHSHVPAELAPEALVGKIAHHTPAYRHTLDCGFSPVVVVAGFVWRSVQVRPLGGSEPPTSPAIS